MSRRPFCATVLRHRPPGHRDTTHVKLRNVAIFECRNECRTYFDSPDMGFLIYCESVTSLAAVKAVYCHRTAGAVALTI